MALPWAPSYKITLCMDPGWCNLWPSALFRSEPEERYDFCVSWCGESLIVSLWCLAGRYSVLTARTVQQDRTLLLRIWKLVLTISMGSYSRGLISGEGCLDTRGIWTWWSGPFCWTFSKFRKKTYRRGHIGKEMCQKISRQILFPTTQSGSNVGQCSASP